jgi:hypothetical protein
MVPILNVLVPRFTVDDEDGGCCTKPELEFLEIILILLPVSALLVTPEIVAITPLAGADP